MLLAHVLRIVTSDISDISNTERYLSNLLQIFFFCNSLFIQLDNKFYKQIFIKITKRYYFFVLFKVFYVKIYRLFYYIKRPAL